MLNNSNYRWGLWKGSLQSCKIYVNVEENIRKSVSAFYHWWADWCLRMQEVPLDYPGPRGFLLIVINLFLLEICDAKRWSKRRAKRKPLVKTVGILTFMPSAFDRHFWLEDIFNCSTSHLIGWIKYLWGCDWSTENDIFDSCQVVDQRESEILNDLDQWLSFLSAWRFDQCFTSQISK